ncbi:DUF4240 domain-containing protein [Hymenobacter sp. BT559]|uniref:DUF4240 domain-containing protein n=1 Tax=Hymenobacter sp. BT559 TaxID=2795729 RepID=UPI0018EA72BD|nr:DUF4240 domain-containing protein [Hymenobacter sp. BT559]MBJ6145899.1 DUF4240 domain-containing protein [Hymenobacter sp. BT559]
MPSIDGSQLEYHAIGKMNKEEFWRVIDFAHQQAKGNEQVFESLLIKNLGQYSPEGIVEFECLLEQQLLDADDFKIMAAQKIIEGSVTDDSYLYFRCWLISQGKSVFEEVLRNPDSLASIDTEGAIAEFEPLLYVATQAYENKTGKKEEDASFPRSVASARGLNYDSAAGTKGEDWTEEQLPTLLPKLWAKHN